MKTSDETLGATHQKMTTVQSVKNVYSTQKAFQLWTMKLDPLFKSLSDTLNYSGETVTKNECP
jgi:hypothetical protein